VVVNRETQNAGDHRKRHSDPYCLCKIVPAVFPKLNSRDQQARSNWLEKLDAHNRNIGMPGVPHECVIAPACGITLATNVTLAKNKNWAQANHPLNCDPKKYQIYGLHWGEGRLASSGGPPSSLPPPLQDSSTPNYWVRRRPQSDLRMPAEFVRLALARLDRRSHLSARGEF
jgi:hypothetical protein